MVMRIPVLKTLLIAVFCAGSGACVSNSIRTIPEPPESGQVLAAHALPEVEIQDNEGAVFIGKIIRLDAGQAVVLPSPYWNVEEKKLDLESIVSIKRLDLKDVLGGNTLAGIAVTGIAVGILAGGFARYDEDYKSALAAAPLGGLILGAPLGFLFGGLSSLGDPPRTVNFEKLSPAERIAALKRIMGYRPR
jgi:hypothetical protein